MNGEAADETETEYAGPGYATDADEATESASTLNPLWIVLPLLALAGLGAAGLVLRRRVLVS